MPSGYSAVQDGDLGFSSGFHQREQMECVHRHTGRIYSRSHGKVCTEKLQIHGERACVSVYMPSVQLGYLPSGIYQVAATSGPASAAPRYQAPCISGRLVHPSIVRVQARTHADLVLQVLQHLGWVINFSKSDLVPSQQFDFIGMQFNMCAYTVAPLPKMWVKIQNTLDHWISHLLISARDLHRLLGMLTFMATLVPRGQLRLHPTQWWVSEVWCQEIGSWSDRISVTPTILHQVAWWASPAVLQGVSLNALETEITLFTDASSHGWGA